MEPCHRTQRYFCAFLLSKCPQPEQFYYLLFYYAQDIQPP